MQKSFHPHKTWEDELENNKGYEFHKPILLPFLLYLILLPSILDPIVDALHVS